MSNRVTGPDGVTRE